MKRKLAVAAALVVASSIAGLIGAPEAPAAPTVGDKEWNELFPTTGLTWDQVASVCPLDGATPCNGTVGGRNLTGWVWATEAQVLELFERYAPGITTADPHVSNAFMSGVAFLNEFRWTYYQATTYSYVEYAGGITSTKDAAGAPIGAGGSYDTPFFGGGVGVGPMANVSDPYVGVFLWRTVGGDYTGPVVTPTVNGTLGTNGWYRSNVSVSWSVVDPETPIATTDGCGPSSLTSDSFGVTYTCTASSTSLAGPTSVSTTVKRDATAPSVTCGPTPTYSLTQAGATVSATVADATSGPVQSSLTVAVSTAAPGPRTASVTGTDRAGNTTTTTCPYNVLVPQCKGKNATIIGTGANDTINGSAGPDVIIALAGNDTIYGNGGNDTICGGDGVDYVNGGAGADAVDGGAGNDDIYGGGSADDLDGGADYDSIRGDAGADRCTSGEARMSSCAYLY